MKAKMATASGGLSPPDPLLPDSILWSAPLISTTSSATEPNGCVIAGLWYGTCADQRRPFVTQKEKEGKANIGYC